MGSLLKDDSVCVNAALRLLVAPEYIRKPDDPSD